MLYLLDANVLIDANRDYYPVSRVPEFWEWLAYMGSLDRVKVPVEVYEEIKDGNDDLAEWIRQDAIYQALVFEEEVEVALVSHVVDEGYADDLRDDEVEKLGRDPFLIAYALTDPSNRVVVTTEASKPRRRRANRHVPDVCSDFGIRSCDSFRFLRELDFGTDWKSRVG